MKGFWAVTAMSFRTWWRDRSSVFWGILFPILLMGLIGLVFGGGESIHFRVSVASQEGDPLGRHLVEALSDVDAFSVFVESEEEGLERLKSGDRNLVVAVPPATGPQDPVELSVYYDETRSQINQAGLAIVSEVVHEINKAMTGRQDVVTVAATPMRAEHLTMFDFLLPGVIAMTIMQTGLMGVTYVIANYREKLVLKRVLATPTHPFGFIAGLVARFTVVNLFQAIIIFLVATFLFGAKTVGSVAQLAVVAVIGSVAFLAIGFAVSTLSKTAESANNLGSLLNFPMLFLSGTFWPKEMLPEGVRSLVAALPLTPLVDAMRGIGAGGESISAYWGGLAYLLGWAVLGFVVAGWRFRWE